MVDKCCFFVPLGAAIKLIAITELIVSGGMVIFSSATLVDEKEGRNRDELLHILYSSTIDVLFAIYLLFALFKSEYKMVRVWYSAQTVHLVASIFLTVYTILFLRRSYPPLQDIAAFLVTSGLDAYLIIVAYSFYQLKKKQARLEEPDVRVT